MKIIQPEVHSNNQFLPGSADEFIEQNLGLARKVAWGFIRAASRDNRIKFDEDDFFSIAYIGLWKAYVKFDPTGRIGADGGQIKFSTLAVPIIKREIMKQTRDYAYTIRNKDRNSKERYPIDYLDCPINGEDSLTLGEVYQKICVDDYDQIIINDFLSQIQPNFRRFYNLITHGLSQATIAKMLGISQVSVCRMGKKLIELAEKYSRGERANETMKGYKVVARLEELSEVG